MKKYIYLILVLFGMTACGDFLEEKSQDQIIPTDIKDVTELIYGELIQRNVDIQEVWDVMSDDVTSKWRNLPGKDDFNRKALFSFYTWKKNIEYDMEDNFKAESFYANLYKDIVLCNSLEEMIPELDGGEAEKWNALGEIYFFRAWAYLDLANIYAVPYVDEATSKVTPCVPINNEKGLGMVLYLRSTQREVFDLIERDIEQAVSCFEKSGLSATIYRPGVKAACILATRIFLIEKKYDKVVAYANKIDGLTTLFSMKDYVERYGVVENLNDPNFDKAKYVHFVDKNNTEIVFTYKDGYGVGSLSPVGSRICGMYFPSEELLSLYREEDDLRRKVYFDKAGYITKYSHNARSVEPTNLKLTEALLNRAEAYAHLDKDKAEEDLLVLRRSRFASSEIPAITGDVLEAVKLERRRELCFEGMRWLDLRRWGMPEIVHDYYLNDNARKSVYVLKKEDAGYTFNLPKAVLDLNQEILEHVRPDRQPVIQNL